ncbi:hypothetical protein AB0C12_30655 [Actinoplanes sp. NPDC048967]|uniref:hypothetical protein n=1 Tax=Actinoplanes sp. NPDC048967 TaxID=3155269 RepID=UPI00340D98B9
MTNPEQRRLRRSAVQHGIAVVVFAMLALSGVGAAGPGRYGLAVPFIVTGVAGAAGAAVIAVTVWRLQREQAGVRPGGGTVNDAAQRTVRLAMTAAAVVAVIAGWMLAPRGMDRGFVISVAAGLAVVLALFSLFAGDRPRTADHPR